MYQKYFWKYLKSANLLSINDNARKLARHKRGLSYSENDRSQTNAPVFIKFTNSMLFCYRYRDKWQTFIRALEVTGSCFLCGKDSRPCRDHFLASPLVLALLLSSVMCLALFHKHQDFQANATSYTNLLWRTLTTVINHYWPWPTFHAWLNNVYSVHLAPYSVNFLSLIIKCHYSLDSLFPFFQM